MSKEAVGEEKGIKKKKRYKSEHKLKVLTYHLLSKFEHRIIKTKP